jgi:hypothetical protein
MFDLPARDQSQQSTNPGNAHFFGVDHPTDTLEAIDISFVVPPVAGISSGGNDQAFALIHPDRGNGNPEDIGRFADGVREVC